MTACIEFLSLVADMHVQDIPSRRARREMLLAWQVTPWRCRVEHLGRKAWMRLSIKLTRQTDNLECVCLAADVNVQDVPSICARCEIDCLASSFCIVND